MNSDRSGGWWSLGFFIPGIAVFLMGAGIIPVEPDSIHIPRWMLVFVGIPFASVGLYLLSQSVESLAWVKDYVGLVIFTSFSFLSVWIAFGPGERQFESNVPFMASELPGRIVFGVSGIFLTIITCIGWYRVAKYWMTGKKNW